MQRWQVLILIAIAIGILAVVNQHSESTQGTTPVRNVPAPRQVHLASITFVDENGIPLDVNVMYTMGGQKHWTSGHGTVEIPENADYAVAYTKDRIPVKILAIRNGRKVVLPTDPTVVREKLQFRGCDKVWIAPIGAPLTDQFACEENIALPEGVYHFAAADANGCIIGTGEITLREDRVIQFSEKNTACKRVEIHTKDAETSAPLKTYLTIAEGNTTACVECNGVCEMGVDKDGADVYAWRPEYLRAYFHITEKNVAELRLNRAVSGEAVRIHSDGQAIVITDRDGVVVLAAHNGETNAFLPDGSYYVYAERWPLVTRVSLTVPDQNNVSVSVQPQTAKIMVGDGETVYVDDAPVCRGPATCDVPALAALRVLNTHGEQQVIVMLPGEERII